MIQKKNIFNAESLYIQRAVDLLYAMCDRTNSEEIVLEMLGYLETADYSIREEMVGQTFFWRGGGL